MNPDLASPASMPGSRAAGSGANPFRRTTPLVLFLLLAFGLSWAGWALVIAGGRGWLALPLPPFALMILAGFGPLLAGVAASAAEGGRPAVRRLLSGLLRWRVGGLWFLVLLALLVLRLLPVGAHILSGGRVDWAALGPQMLAFPLILLFIAVMGGGLDEEVGWRGYALPRLQDLLPPVPANLVLGLVWSAWHLPLFLMPGSTHGESSLLLYVVETTALSFVLGWIWNGTRGSLLLVVLAHAVSNAGDNLRYVAVGFVDGAAEVVLIQGTLAGIMTLVALALVLATQGGLGPSSDAARTG
jgi:membrane protease YdiL (CAAX protease family)